MVVDEDAQVVCAVAVKMEAARMEDRGVEARRNCEKMEEDGGAAAAADWWWPARRWRRRLPW